MNPRILIILLLTPLLFLITACDQACDVKVTSVAKIDNKASAPVELKVCVRSLSNENPHRVVKLAYDQSGQVALQTHTQKKIKTGGPASACDPTSQSSGVFLTSESFSMVKFCHNPETTAEVVVVETYQNCPNGLIEQTRPIDNCNSF